MGYSTIGALPAAGTLTGDELVEVSQVSTTVTVSAATISALASDNSFNDSGSGFVTAGFAAGDRVRVTGFTGDVANNILVGVITALTAGKMTIGGTDGDVIVDDAAGETVTISKWGSRRTTVADILDGATGSTSYVVPLGFTSTPTASEVLLLHTFAETVTFPANWSGVQKYVGTNPGATFALTIEKSTGGGAFSSVGSLSFSTSGVLTATTSGGTPVTFNAGDTMRISGPGSADASAANISATLIGERA